MTTGSSQSGSQIDMWSDKDTLGLNYNDWTRANEPIEVPIKAFADGNDLNNLLIAINNTHFGAVYKAWAILNIKNARGDVVAQEASQNPVHSVLLNTDTRVVAIACECSFDIRITGQPAISFPRLDPQVYMGNSEQPVLQCKFAAEIKADRCGRPVFLRMPVKEKSLDDGDIYLKNNFHGEDFSIEVRRHNKIIKTVAFSASSRETYFNVDPAYCVGFADDETTNSLWEGTIRKKQECGQVAGLFGDRSTAFEFKIFPSKGAVRIPTPDEIDTVPNEDCVGGKAY